MVKSPTLRGLLLGTAMAVPFAASGYAQTIEINPDELAGKSAECRELAELVQNRDESIETVPTEEIVTALNTDNSEECTTLRMSIASAGGESQAADATERVSEEVELSEEATIEGRAVVSVPEPEVDVQVPPPNVRVTEQHPQINITQESAQIDLQQGRPRIVVEIPEIVVRVEIPAPRLYVLRQDPQVQVSAADPQVEVVQGDPQVIVRQADPELNVDLGVDVDQEAEEGTLTAGATQEVSGQEQQVEGDVSVSGDQAQVEIVRAEGQPQMSYESGEPQLAYENVEPEVSVMMAEQPTIEVQQSGDATIVLETPEEREQRRQQQQNTNQATSEQQQNANQAMSEQQQPTSRNAMTIGELMDMEVVTVDGEELGSPQAFIEINGEPNLVLESGGFLGIGGKEVPVPLSRVSVQGEQLLLNTLSEEEIEMANDFDYDENLRLPDDRQIEIGG